MSIEEQILQILAENEETRPHDLALQTGASRQFVQRIIKKLVENGRLIKVGTPPRTYYKLREEKPSVLREPLPDDQELFLQENFLLITETGSRLEGVEAFNAWCQRQKLPFEKSVREYISTRKKYLKFINTKGLIDGTKKISGTKGFSEIGLDKVFYPDFYAIERFGKTKLGTLLHFAKQGQNRKLMVEIINIIKERVYKLVASSKIDAVGYIPPTLKREIQIMKVLREMINLPLPHIELVKVRGEITVPQKALNKIEDRIRNARFSIMVKEKRTFKNVLLIDDAIGSGATMNETAIKLKKKRIARKIIGLAITGSYKGFDVIQEI